MITVRFVSSDEARIQAVEAQPGDRLLEVGQNAGQPLEGTCEGQMACSTCHVIVDAADFDRLPKAREEEEDMLDLAAGATRYSRLACQIVLSAALDGLTVRIPPESRDMQGTLIHATTSTICAFGSRADGALANLVRSGRKQPQRIRTGSFRLPPRAARRAVSAASETKFRLTTRLCRGARTG